MSVLSVNNLPTILAGLAPDEHVVLILLWAEEPDLTALQAIPDVGERRGRLDAFYDDLKRPLLNALAAEPGVRVTNPLNGAGQAIAAAEAQTWLALLGRPDTPLGHPGLGFRMNGLVYAI